MRSFRIAGLLAVALLVAAWLAWTPRSRADNDDTWADLHGTWVVTATPGDVVVAAADRKSATPLLRSLSWLLTPPEEP
jgi:hypothetical protein